MVSVHSFEPGFQITCGIDECPRTYTNFQSFRSIIIRRRYYINLDESEPSGRDNASYEHDEPEDSNPPLSVSGEKNDLKRSAALFLLKTKEVSRISRSALDAIIGDVSQLFEAHLSNLKQEIEASIQKNTSSCDILTTVHQCFRIPQPFTGLESEYLLRKYLKEELDFLVRLNI